MNGKPPRKNALSVLPSIPDEGTCEGDLEALENFCNQVELDDISFETWKQTHSNLDLLISVPMRLALLQKGGKQTISFVRTILSICGRYKKKEKIDRQISWPKTSESLVKLRFKNEGDQAGKQKGDLIVHLTCTD
ncbi:MAG: hypothetical protein HRU09_03885 [Oligoflexales bacterium]|nr:hypothetical protein [Oligoflexales bacterium]